jgi:adenylate kinase
VNLVFIGAQGSGKGTQASMLIERLGIGQLSSGDIFRNAIQQRTPLGVEAQKYMDRGELVPDNVTIRLVLDLLATPEYTPGVILDRFPRTRDQAIALDDALPRLSRAIDYAIYLNVPQNLLRDRLLYRYVCTTQQHVYNLKTKPPRIAGICDIDGSPLIQRSDDTPANIERRLQIFFEQTIQVVHYYRAQRKLIEVNGNQPITEVSTSLLAALGVRPENAA